MSSLGNMAIWGVLQVSAVTLFAVACYALVRKRGPAARSQVVMTSLAVTLLVAALTVSPWPRWFSVSPAAADAAAKQLAENELTATQVAESDATDHAALATDSAHSKQTPNPVDVAGAFWQTLLRELATPPADAAPGFRFSWPLMLVIAMSIALLLGAARLMLGLWGVHRLRRGSRPVTDQAIHDEAERLKRAMGCRKPIEVRSSDRLASPVTIGWRRALILLPSDWEAWNAAELRAALAHELAHISHGDYAAGLVAQLCVAANFYHPLVHWLARRLRLEQELAADAAAATAMGSRGEYLLTLAQLALRCDDRPMAWAARPFLPARGALSRRIEMLRDARQIFVRPLSGGLRAIMIAALVGAGILAAGVRGPGAALAQKPVFTGTLSGGGFVAKKEPFDLSQMPRDPYVIIAARPWQILTQQGFEPIAKIINESNFQNAFGMPVEEIDEIVCAGKFDALIKRKTAGDPPPAAKTGHMRMSIRSKKPIDPTKFVLGFPTPAAAQFEVVEGKRLYLANAPELMSYFFADDRTVVLGESEELRAWLKAGDHKNWAPPTWSEVATTDLALWLDVKSVRPALNETKNLLEMQLLSPFALLWEKTDTLVAGATIDDMFRLKAAARCTNSENAERVQKTLEAAITLATNSAGVLGDEANPDPQAAQLTVMARAFVKLLSEVKITRDESELHATVETPLAPLLQLSALVPAVSTARDAARRAQSVNNMKQLGLAMHNYADRNKHFPPAVVIGPDGKTPHSWRVEILPYLEESGKKLYDEYKLNEPWDSENNKKVLAKMPAAFRCPQDDPMSTNASYFAVVGPQTIYHDEKGTSLRQITDGTSNTIMFVDAKRDIPWTKPEDIDVPADKPLPKIGGWFTGVTLVSMADGSVHTLEEPIKEDLLRALLSRGGGEPVTPPR